MQVIDPWVDFAVKKMDVVAVAVVMAAEEVVEEVDGLDQTWDLDSVMSCLVEVADLYVVYSLCWNVTRLDASKDQALIPRENSALTRLEEMSIHEDLDMPMIVMGASM